MCKWNTCQDRISSGALVLAGGEEEVKTLIVVSPDRWLWAEWRGLLLILWVVEAGCCAWNWGWLLLALAAVVARPRVAVNSGFRIKALFSWPERQASLGAGESARVFYMIFGAGGRAAGLRSRRVLRWPVLVRRTGRGA